MRRSLFLLCAMLGLVSFVPAFASASCVSLSRDLTIGSSGADVIVLQQFLASGGYFNATPVDYFGRSTLAAVRAFQHAQSISTTGTVGSLTRAAIASVSCGTIASTTGATPSSTNTSSGAFEVSGWLPYWRGATTTNDVLPHLSELTEVNPFVYSLKSDGTILDNAPMTDPEWQQLVAAARAQKVRVIPTIMTGDSALLHTLLASSRKRVALETTIARFVKQNNFDGIEIDFEGKAAADKNYFSTFLKGLYARMGQKWVVCDIEARTPTDSRYFGTTVPPDAEVYANDFSAINAYCDRVKIMAYDQQGVDLALAAAAASSSELYAPVSDPVWVTKVVQLTEQSIKKSKIILGIPTYGYEYDVTAYAGNQYVYNMLWTFNPGYAAQIAQQFGVAPTRATWGEMNLSYFGNSNSTTTPSNLSASPFIANAAAVAAATYASSTNSHVDFRYLVWPDAASISQKIALAQQLGIRGVAVFKFDGGEDPNIWAILTGVKK